MLTRKEIHNKKTVVHEPLRTIEDAALAFVLDSAGGIAVNVEKNSLVMRRGGRMFRYTGTTREIVELRRRLHLLN